MQKTERERSQEEKELLLKSSSIVKQVALRYLLKCSILLQRVTPNIQLRLFALFCRLEKRKLLQARSEEFEDCTELLEVKCAKLAAAIAVSKNLVVYSGAGVSTAASIPDYRGTNGIWTRLQQGKDIG